MNTAAQHARRARIALGFALILLLFLGETIVAHQRLPQPASPVVWALLGGGAIVCLGLGAWYRRAARRR